MTLELLDSYYSGIFAYYLPDWSGRRWYCFIRSQWLCKALGVRPARNDVGLSAIKSWNDSRVGAGDVVCKIHKIQE